MEDTSHSHMQQSCDCIFPDPPPHTHTLQCPYNTDHQDPQPPETLNPQLKGKPLKACSRKALQELCGPKGPRYCYGGYFLNSYY